MNFEHDYPQFSGASRSTDSEVGRPDLINNAHAPTNRKQMRGRGRKPGVFGFKVELGVSRVISLLEMAYTV